MTPRTDTDEKPFPCLRCAVGFSRRDVQEKHTRRCSVTPVYADATGASILGSPDTGQRRVHRACDRCRQRKLKCDGYQPCEPYFKQSIVCTSSAATTSRSRTTRRSAAPPTLDAPSVVEADRSLLPAISEPDPSQSLSGLAMGSEGDRNGTMLVNAAHPVSALGWNLVGAGTTNESGEGFTWNQFDADADLMALFSQPFGLFSIVSTPQYLARHTKKLIRTTKRGCKTLTQSLHRCYLLEM